jgi:hypothetical protein
MDAQLCDYIKGHRIKLFKWVNFMAYKLYLNNDVTLSVYLSIYLSREKQTDRHWEAVQIKSQ